MKKHLKTIGLVLTLLLFYYNSNSQEITLTGPSSVNNNTEFVLSSAGETGGDYHIYSLYDSYASVSYNSSIPPNLVSCSLISGCYYHSTGICYASWGTSTTGSFTRLTYKLVNNHTSPVEVTLSIRVKVKKRLEGVVVNYAFEDKILTFTLTVNPTPSGVATKYFYLGSLVTHSEYINIRNLDRNGENLPGTSTSGPRLLQENFYNPSQATVKFGINDGSAAYELTYKDSGELPPFGGIKL